MANSVYLLLIWYICPRLGMLHQEKSGISGYHACLSTYIHTIHSSENEGENVHTKEFEKLSQWKVFTI
jgi:hypothetical protein